jgi:ribosomal protein S18 acetylase RimI-like enzyme
MAMNLDELADPGLEFVIDRPPWDGSVHLLERMEGPPGLLADIDGAPFNARTVVIDGVAVAAALAFDHAGDCGIYNVGTLPHARRRGLASSLTAAQLRAARERGCTTASLQSTEMAERLYARLGFRDLGRFVEYVPGARQALA